MENCVSIPVRTPQQLCAKPELLLHSANPGAVVRPFDGIVGNVLPGGEFVITSPNADYIPFPPLGDERSVYLRADYHYADDDPILWPQPFHPTIAHQAAIPRPPREDDPKSIMWWPTDKFTLHQLLNRSVGWRLDAGQRDQIQETVVALLARVDAYHLECREKGADIVRSTIDISTLLVDFLLRLRTLPMTRNELKRCIVETKRFYLELTGLLDYITIFQPRMNSPGPYQPRPVADTMGAYSLDPLVVQTFARAGLRVWFIRRSLDVPAIRVDRVAPFIMPDTLVFADASPRYPAIFKGTATDPRRTQEMRVAARYILHCPDAFYWASAPEREDPPPPPSPSTSKSSSLVAHPYRSKKLDAKQRKALVNRLVVIPPESWLMPSMSPGWFQALVHLKSLPFPTEIACDMGFTMPDPSLFVNFVQPHSYRVNYIRRYLQLRTSLLHRLTVSPAVSPISRPLLNRVWRGVLSMDLKVVTNTINATGKLTKSAKENLEGVQFLTGCASLVGMTVAEMLSSPAVYRGREVSEDELKDAAVARNVLWEISELNFRSDFMSLDSAFESTLESDERKECVLDCLCPAGTPRYPLIVDPAYADVGPAAPSPSSRLAQLQHMRRLFSSWTIKSPPSFLASDSPSDADILILERQLFTFFTEQFFNHFGRSPITPRILSLV